MILNIERQWEKWHIASRAAEILPFDKDAHMRTSGIKVDSTKR